MMKKNKQKLMRCCTINALNNENQTSSNGLDEEEQNSMARIQGTNNLREQVQTNKGLVST